MVLSLFSLQKYNENFFWQWGEVRIIWREHNSFVETLEFLHKNPCGIEKSLYICNVGRTRKGSSRPMKRQACLSFSFFPKAYVPVA